MATSTFAKEINLYWAGDHDLTFEVVFYDGVTRYFDFFRQSEGYTNYILTARDDPYNDEILFQMTVTYKTKVETAIPKCLSVLRKRFMEKRWDD